MGWFLFLVLSFLLSHFPSQTSLLMAFCNHDDASALLSFKSSFSLNISSQSSLGYESPYPKIESWENGRNCCLWEGMSCDTKSSHVIGIDLSCSFLQGEFHPNTTLFKRIHLQKLNLAFNDFFNSPMPNGFGDHVALTHLNLSTSEFSGVIPSKISHLSKFVSLDLSFLEMRIEAATLDNVIVNVIDIWELTLDGLDMSSIKRALYLCELLEFNQSTPLRYLDLSVTGFSGKLPNNINHLESLNYLDFEFCDFEGPISLFLSNLTQVKHLDLGFNNFSSEIQSSLSNLQHLTFIDLSDNSFTGPIAKCFGNITQLNHLNLCWNNFSGEIPSSLSNLQCLTYINLFDNSFTGPIPQCFGNITQVSHLTLHGNKFRGEIMPSFNKGKDTYLLKKLPLDAHHQLIYVCCIF
ncbi:Receptor-like protein 6 [Glycine max]|nr:Receptor-like protein 6 [Glycine max]